MTTARLLVFCVVCLISPGLSNCGIFDNVKGNVQESGEEYNVDVNSISEEQVTLKEPVTEEQVTPESPPEEVEDSNIWTETVSGEQATPETSAEEPVPEEQVTPESSPEGNGNEQTIGILTTLLRNLDKTEDGIEATKKSIHELARHINPDGEEQLNLLTSKHKKYSLVTFFQDTWRGAVRYCKHRGMELASIENENEQRQLDDIIDELGFNVFPLWIAASDIATESVFTWGSSGKPITYSNWNAGEPNGMRKENCVVLERTGEGYLWADISCENSYYFACQYFGGRPNQ